MDASTAASLLEAMGNPVRLRALIELRRAGDAGLSVGALQERLGIDAKSTLSNHLRQLVHAGLVTQERRSTVLLCRAPAGPLAGLVDYLTRAALTPGDMPTA
ncbi:MAG: winged helix-turn-helix transcriptional regulator [Parafilimonas terrae]|nr:winged helix-turn-helix transcriptional regulator [Parafilimonas terrae]